MESIEEFADRVPQLWEDRRFGHEIRYEIESRLDEWESHIRQLKEHTFGREGLLEIRPANLNFLDEDRYSTFSDLVETPIPDKWPPRFPGGHWPKPIEPSHAHCYTCDTPLDVLHSLLEERDQLPLVLAIEQISEICEAECIHFATGNLRCTEEHIKAHITLLDTPWTIKGEMLCLEVEAASTTSEADRPILDPSFGSVGRR